MIESGKGVRFSSSVKHLQNMHLSAPSPQIHLGWTIDGRSKKGRFKHTLYFGTLHSYLRSAYASPELFGLTFSAEPASGLGQSSTADQPWMAHGGIFHELQDVLSHELQNGPCRKTFELEYLEILIKL